MLVTGILQDTVRGNLVDVYVVPDDDGRQLLAVLFRYSTEDPEYVRIHYGDAIAGPTGELLEAPILEEEEAFELLRRVEAAGGPENLPCRIFYGGGPTRVYSPSLVEADHRFPRAVILLALPTIVLLSRMLHFSLCSCRAW